jgi:hypothetical protein
MDEDGGVAEQTMNSGGAPKDIKSEAPVEVKVQGPWMTGPRTFISLSLLIPTDQVRMRALAWRGRRETRGPVESMDWKGKGGEGGKARKGDLIAAYRPCRKWVLRARWVPPRC